MKKILSILLLLTLMLSLLVGCGKDVDSNTPNESQDGTSSTVTPVEVDFSKTEADMFTERDNKTEYDEAKAVTIKLNGTTAIASSDSVKISGSKVTITEEATYVVSGELTDGMLIVDAPDTAKLQIVLNGANITSKTSAALQTEGRLVLAFSIILRACVTSANSSI